MSPRRKPALVSVAEQEHFIPKNILDVLTGRLENAVSILLFNSGAV